MSIAIEQIRDVTNGSRKQIEMESMDQIFDNLQVSQYSHPIRSTIRELVSNGYDSVVERNIALKILSGEAKVEDYYIHREGPKYESSNFDPSYYDPKWLDKINTVQIVYESKGLNRDKVSIIDSGVGLGGKRLEGYFKLAYSTKKNTTFSLGKYGLGAKAPLSTGVPFYSIVNRYNGKEYHFNIYVASIESTVPPFDLITGEQYQYDTLYEGTPFEIRAYWKPTTRKNSLEVSLEVKKSKKSDYEEAVKGQILYFKDVEFIQVDEDGNRTMVPIRPNILYEDDYLIISDNKLYSKPHLVLNGVNYGYIDFGELELEQKLGNVGIKVSLEDVAVTQSRESVIWNEQTKKVILDRFKTAAGIATNIIQSKLKDKDIIAWLRAWNTIRNSEYKADSNDAVAQMAQIVNIRELEPSYSVDTDIVAGRIEYTFPGMQVQRIKLEESTKGGVRKKKLDRVDVGWTGDIDPKYPVLISRGKPSLTALRYFATQHANGYYLIRYPEDPENISDDVDDESKDTLNDYNLSELADSVKEFKRTPPKSWSISPSYPIILRFLIGLRKKVIGYLEASTLVTKITTIKVPDDFSWVEGEEIDLKSTEQQLEEMSPAERRKLEQRIVAYTPRGFDRLPYVGDLKAGEKAKLYTYQKVEPRLIDVQNLEGEVYYGYSDEESRHAMDLAAFITRPDNKKFQVGMWPEVKSITEGAEFKDKWGLTHSYVNESVYSNYYLPGSRVTLLRIAQDQTKYFKQYRPIQEFFLRLENNVLTMSTLLVKWHTARKVHEKLSLLNFFHNFQIFNSELAAKYKKVHAYHEENYRNIGLARTSGNKYFGLDEQIYNDLVTLDEKLTTIQLYVIENPTDLKTIGEMTKSLAGIEAEGAYGLDLDIWNDYQELLDYASSAHPLLNQITPLIGDHSISEELEREIRFYLNAKRL